MEKLQWKSCINQATSVYDTKLNFQNLNPFGPDCATWYDDSISRSVKFKFLVQMVLQWFRLTNMLAILLCPSWYWLYDCEVLWGKCPKQISSPRGVNQHHNLPIPRVSWFKSFKIICLLYQYMHKIVRWENSLLKSICYRSGKTTEQTLPSLNFTKYL
jgi:hypothetical protein